MIARLLPLLLLIGAQDSPPPAAPIGFDNETMETHRITGEHSLTVPAGGAATFMPVAVRVTVSPEGEVIDAMTDPAPGDSAEMGLVLAEARRWRFRPFNYRGRPVAARGLIQIGFSPASEWRDPDAAFPPVDYPSLRITLHRASLGDEYRITIDGAGNVTFANALQSYGASPPYYRNVITISSALIPGEHRSRIDRAALDALLDRFRSARFFGLKPVYAATVSHGLNSLITFETGGRSFTVRDYWSRLVGGPPELRQLADAIEEAVGAARWTEGNGETVAALRAEGFDFQSTAAMRLAGHAMVSMEDKDRLLADMIEAGLPLERPFHMGDDPGELSPRLGEQMLILAAIRGRPLTFAALVARGWAARVPRGRLSEAFASGAGGCDPALARAIVAAGADPNARTRFAETGGRPRGATALMVALTGYLPCQDRPRGPLIGALVALGVDINAEDEAGRTALYGVQSVELVEQLLALGARARMQDRSGLSPLFFANSERVLLALLDAGADPSGRSPRLNGGMTMREIAMRFEMPTLLARLEGRGAR